ncbi:MAG: hypothetical protein M1818_000992 [Claussenomyces sp. TS43310]|nr:MAG: hypothetical protein M1818_000992 [Claussenomyces sp. TS43310]
MGFTAIWISPVVTNINSSGGDVGEAYHGFWSKDITTINTNMGTPDDLVALSKALHDRDMYLMVDAVLNNMAYQGPGNAVQYSIYTPFDSQEYFHSFCYISNYSNWTNAQQCWLGDDVLSLPDLNTENPTVVSILDTWAKGMVSNYSVDGFRIDAAKHVAKPFWASFYPTVDIYMVGEVFDGDPETVCSYQSNTQALPAVLNYAMWYALTDVFSTANESMSQLDIQYETVASSCQDSTLLGTFTENQDVARFANLTNDLSQQKNAIVFALMSDGIPILYYGAEQAFATGGDPDNREALWLTKYDTSGELYKTIAAANIARNVIADRATYTYWSGYWTWKSKVILTNDNIMVLRKGYDYSVLAIVSNKGVGAPEMGPYAVGDTNFNEGDVIVDVVGCTKMTVGQYGELNITVPAGGKPMVYIPAKWITNTTACPDLMKEMSASDLTKTPSSAITRNVPLQSSVSALLVLVMAAMALL